MTFIRRTWQVENTWVCDSCQEKNLGRFTECQKCGSAKEKHEQDAEVPDPDHTVPVTDPELLRLATQGANWVCEFCAGQVRDEFGKCRNCAGPREEPKPPPDPAPEPVRAERPRQEAPKQASQPTPQTGWPRRLPLVEGKLPPWTAKVPWFWVIGGLVGVIALIGLGFFLFATWEVLARVSSIHWHHKANLRQRTLMHGSGWGAPSGSFNQSCYRRFYGTEDCNPYKCRPHSESYECNCHSETCNCHNVCSPNGNGFSTCHEVCSTCRRCSTCTRTVYDTCYEQCDVYRSWCSYDYYEWPIIRTLATEGSEHNERWPELEAVGAEQRLERIARYEVKFQRSKKEWTLKPSALSDFQRFRVGTGWRIKVNRVGSVTPLREEN